MNAEFDPNDGDDEFMSTILTAAAAKESADKSRRMIGKQADKAKRGEHHGGRRGYGHTLDRNALVPEEARAIRKAVRRVPAGEPTYAIVRDWIAEGRKTTTGGEWRPDTVAALLQQPRLAGLRRIMARSSRRASGPRSSPRTSIDRPPHCSRRRRRGPQRSRGRKHLLVGLLRCHKCGHLLRANVRRNDHQTRYMCPPKTQGGCGGVSIVKKATEDAVRDLVLDYYDSPMLAEWMERSQREAARANASLGELAEQLNRDRRPAARDQR